MGGVDLFEEAGGDFFFEDVGDGGGGVFLMTVVDAEGGGDGESVVKGGGVELHEVGGGDPTVLAATDVEFDVVGAEGDDFGEVGAVDEDPFAFFAGEPGFVLGGDA